MRRISAFVLSTISVVVLLFSYSTSTAGPLATAAPPAAESGSTAGSTGTTTGGTTTGGATTGTSGSTVTGQVVSTRWGPVQVAITVAGGRLTGVQVLQQPTGNPKDEEINAHALPILTSEAVDAQSADIDMVSGATVTSEGYLSSLQSALDQAGL